MLEALAQGRPAGDILGRLVRITLGGQEYALPVRSIKANREWKAQLDAQTAAVVDGLVSAGNDEAEVLRTLARDVDPFIELLVSYAPDVLSRDLIEGIEPDASLDVLAACQEVWLAASPLVATGIEAIRAMEMSSPPTSSSPPSTAGSPTTSTDGSPTSSSSPTSTEPESGSRADEQLTSKPRSSRSGPATSSPATRSSSDAGDPTRRDRTDGRRASRATSSRQRSPASPRCSPTT